ncbi:hypothetical protein KR222_000828 [Zaprionus bogoriensis]|nr:hypothetical protein KR222_000828 [Zaprionus bogoriensis]
MSNNQEFISAIGRSDQEQEPTPSPSPDQTKRNSLNERIYQVYLINGVGHKLPKESASTQQEQWQQVDTCLQPERVGFRSSLNQVKRQLFRIPRSYRKCTQPKRRRGSTEAFNFKPLRSQIGRKSIRRGFLWHTRREVLEQMLQDTIELEMAYAAEQSVCQLILDTIESIPNMCPAVVELLKQRTKRNEAQNDRFQMRESENLIIFAKHIFSLCDDKQGYDPGCC